MLAPDIILSDLHLGHPAGTVGDIHSLTPLLEPGGRILLNGDTLETCSPVLEPPSREAYAALIHLAKARDTAIDRLRGNHDPDQDAPSHLELDDRTVLVTHGDVCYRFGSPWSPWVPRLRSRLEVIEGEFGGRAADLEVAAQFARALAWARAFHPRPRHFTGWLGKFETISHALWPPATPLSILHHWIHGPALAAQWLATAFPEARVLVMGHTHRAGIWQHKGRWIINTGAFHPFSTPHIVRRQPGRLDLCPLTRRHNHWQPGAPRACLVRADSGWMKADP